ncbi:hypothetical protein GCM10027615_05370 [Plantactinospora veratri]
MSFDMFHLPARVDRRRDAGRLVRAQFRTGPATGGPERDFTFGYRLDRSTGCCRTGCCRFIGFAGTGVVPAATYEG